MTALDDCRGCAHAHAAFDEFTLPGAERHYPPDLELEPTHLGINIHLDLEAQRCDATVSVTVVARSPGAHVLRLDGVDFEELRVADSDAALASFGYDGKAISIAWKDPFAQGDQRKVVLFYRVVRPTSGILFSRPSAAYPDAPLFAVTDHETERARYWLACLDHPSARPRIDWQIRAPRALTILAGGVLLSEEDHGDGEKTAHWRLDAPCPSYLVCFAVGDFIVLEDTPHHGIPIASYTTRTHDIENLRLTFGRTREMLAWLTAKLGLRFPYPKYFQFAVPGIGGAMENISLVSWDDNFLLDETLASEWNRLIEQVNIHEMAHSYFGDLVVCRDFAHAWLKESWATYIEQCWFEDLYGEDEKLYEFYTNALAYFGEADERYQRAIVTREFNTSWDMYDRHLYPGGACRLHTLRAEVGDGAFWAGVRDYVATFAGEVVETDDFRRILEKHSGRSLGKFFDQWFFSPGYPFLKVSFHFDPARSEGTFEIEQAQVDEKKGGTIFDLRLDVAWVVDGELQRQRVHLQEARQVVVVPMGRDPDQVRIDPEGNVLFKLEMNPGDDKLRRQITDATDIIGRILAGRELAKTGKSANIEAIAAAYRAESFWGVRAQLADALGRAGVQAAVAALADLVAFERDPRVLEPLFRAAGRYRDPALSAALQARLDGGLPYRATMAAYEALGAQREAAPFERLVAASAEVGFGGFAQAGALRGLGATHREEALEVLLARLEPGAVPARVRIAGVEGLAELGKTLIRRPRERAVERLVDLLRDPDIRIRKTAVAGLEAVGAGEAVPALEAVRGALAAQDSTRIDRAIRTIRREPDPKHVANEKAIDDLRAAVRKLRDEIEKLEARVGAEKAVPAK
jgi:aminopeptidase N